MKYKINLTEQAETDLRDIYEYITYTLLEPRIAAGQLERIEKSIMSLDEMAERYCVFEREPWHSKGLHRMIVDNFNVYYFVKSDNKTVNVVRVLFGGRDVDEQFKMTDF